MVANPIVQQAYFRPEIKKCFTFIVFFPLSMCVLLMFSHAVWLKTVLACLAINLLLFTCSNIKFNLIHASISLLHKL